MAMSTNEPAAAPRGDYDIFVDWDKRLATEWPFFRELFEREGVRKVIDVGAGSARHAIMFATWGLDVVAVDPDESMLEQAHVNAAKFVHDVAVGNGSLDIVEGGFGGLYKLGIGPTDAVTCTGNALPHVAGRDGLTEAPDFARVLVPGGILVLHLLNHARLLESRIRAIPPKVVETDDGTLVFVRVIDYPPGGEYLDFDFVTLSRDACGTWTVSDRRSAHTAIPLSLLESELPCAGFGNVRAFGGHDEHTLSSADESVIVVAQRL
jgi:SAM-dependent methyltransferase